MSRIKYGDGVYIGGTKNVKQHGKGKYTYASGRVLEGRFEKNKFMG